jgi:RNA polymerase sigma factor (sigma-70 family)
VQRGKFVKKEIVLTEEQRNLIENNYRLLFYYIKKEVKSERLLSDLESVMDELNRKFCDAAAHYDSSFGCKFSTFSYKCFDNGMKKLLSKKIREKRKGFKITNVSSKEYQQLEDRRISVDLHFLMTIIDKVSSVSSTNKNILFSYFLENKTLEQTGIIFGKSKERIRQIISDTLFRIKEYIKHNSFEEKDFFMYGLNGSE